MAVVASRDAGLRAESLGATLLQLRAPGMPARQLERAASALVRDARVPVLVNSRVDVALAAGAAGVHLPALDISPADARRLLGADATVSRAVHTPAEAAGAGGADLLVAGPVYATPTHPGADPLGFAGLSAIVAAAAVPVLAIGGVDAARAAEVMAAGAAGYAAIRAFR